jgi:hypothetical protein
MEIGEKVPDIELIDTEFMPLSAVSDKP